MSTVRVGLNDTLVSGGGAGSKRRDRRGYLSWSISIDSKGTCCFFTNSHWWRTVRGEMEEPRIWPRPQHNWCRVGLRSHRTAHDGCCIHDRRVLRGSSWVSGRMVRCAAWRLQGRCGCSLRGTLDCASKACEENACGGCASVTLDGLWSRRVRERVSWLVSERECRVCVRVGMRVRVRVSEVTEVSATAVWRLTASWTCSFRQTRR